MTNRRPRPRLTAPQSAEPAAGDSRMGTNESGGHAWRFRGAGTGLAPQRRGERVRDLESSQRPTPRDHRLGIRGLVSLRAPLPWRRVGRSSDAVHRSGHRRTRWQGQVHPRHLRLGRCSARPSLPDGRELLAESPRRRSTAYGCTSSLRARCGPIPRRGRDHLPGTSLENGGSPCRRRPLLSHTPGDAHRGAARHPHGWPHRTARLNRRVPPSPR